MLLGGGTLGLGILAVLAAIIYRIMTMDATPVPAIAATGAPGTAVPTLSASALGLPADAKLISTAMDGNRLALTYAVGASTETIVVDTRTNAVVNILRMAP